jgi:phosphatidylserine/phosphatidylglycerophosphate/cardiolipin synthase-like enzyme
MANTGVTGFVKDAATGNGISGLTIVAYDREVLAQDVELGRTSTITTGSYSITYSAWAYGIERRPDIVIKVYDSVKRLVHESPEYPDISDPIYAIPDINIDSADLSGFTVTLLSGTPKLKSSGNKITPLIDNEEAFGVLTNDVMAATDSIYFAQLYFDVEELFTVFTPPITIPPPGTPTTGIRLEDELLSANISRSVDVKILVNNFVALPYPADTAGYVGRYFSGAAANSVDVNDFDMPYNRSMHAKMSIVDNSAAVVNASPLLQEYFDDTEHKIENPHRGYLSGAKNAIRVPVHDVSVKIEGPAISNLLESFSVLWEQSGGVALSSTIAAPTSGPGFAHDVQITRTLPGNLFTSTSPAVPAGEKGILESYLRAISEAEELIYIENQYFTERRIADALYLKLIQNADIQIILLLNNLVDIPFYQGYQTNLINQLLNAATSQGVRDRIEIFTLWSHEVTPRQQIMRNYVHSKVGIVDDKWITIGSANLDGVSLYVSQHLISPVTRNDILEEQAIELNMSVFNGVDGGNNSDFPEQMRKQLWVEHLGYSSASDPALAAPPSGGWLDLWKTRAAAKLAGLSSSTPARHDCRVLIWNEEEDPSNYLIALGVPPASISALNVREAVPDFDFDTGQWD